MKGFSVLKAVFNEIFWKRETMERMGVRIADSR
jgi:hypothetical protein